MKILFAAHGNPSRTPGGIETYARCIAPALVDLGHEVHLLWLGFGQGVHDGREGGVTVHLRPWRGPRALGRAVGLPHSWARIRVALAAKAALTQIGRRFDVIEAPEW
ncbi:MAG TPA: glycosyltransferase, partial [Actinomycetota bacterium]|nr:glycosyltransferase [Actinomycetota bacterium]